MVRNARPTPFSRPPAVFVALWLAAGGCYGGLTSGPGGASAEGGQDDAASAGDDGDGDDDDDDDDGEDDGADGEGAGISPARLWRLTPRQYERTISAALGAPIELPSIAITLRTESFINDADGLRVDEVWLSALEADVDAAVADHLPEIEAQLSCNAAAIDETCLAAFVTDLTRRIQRTDHADVSAYVELFHDVAAVESEEAALRAVVTAILLAPKTLFRTEIGDQANADASALTPFEIAEHLAYSIWDGPPDAELVTLALSGELSDPAVVDAQIERMLADPRGITGPTELVSQWLGLTGLPYLTKTESEFPEFGSLRDSMWWETQSYIEHVLVDRDASLGALLGGQESFVDADLAALYGVPTPADGAGLVTLPPERRGIFTQPGVIASMSGAGETAVIYRGKVVLERLLCMTIVPPEDIMFPDFDEFPPEATQRERFESLEQTQPCGACHQMLHPPAFAMESFDPIGRFRETEHGTPIDPSGALEVDGVPVQFDDAADLLGQLADHPAVHECFVEQAFRYTFGRAPTPDDREAIEAATEAFLPEADIVDLMRAMVRASALYLKTKEPSDGCDSP